MNTENFSLSCETRGEKLIVDLTGPGTGWLGFGLEDNLIIVWMEDMLGLPMGEDHFGSLENTETICSRRVPRIYRCWQEIRIETGQP